MSYRADEINASIRRTINHINSALKERNDLAWLIRGTPKGKLITKAFRENGVARVAFTLAFGDGRERRFVADVESPESRFRAYSDCLNSLHLDCDRFHSAARF